MEVREVLVSKPTGAGKRKGANPVRQRQTHESGQSPLDLSVNQDTGHKKVILSVPQYKLVSSAPAHSAAQRLEPELSVTPIMRKNDSHDLSRDDDMNTKFLSNTSFPLHSLLSSVSSQSPSLFSLEQLKQASLIFQKHALNGNIGAGRKNLLREGFKKI